LFIDYAGDILSEIIDDWRGESGAIFVAVIGASNFTYVGRPGPKCSAIKSSTVKIRCLRGGKFDAGLAPSQI
jgi:hypothetical protein